MKSGIYQILNRVNNKFYIGSAVYIRCRFGGHKHLLRKGKHPNKYLQSAWIKYGEENFEFRTLQHVEVDKLIEIEQQWIDWTKCYDRTKGYNLRKLAESNLGYKHSAETNAKQSLLRKGRKQSEETKRKKSIALKGRPLSEENKRNIGLANKGRTYKYAPDRTRLKGRKLPEETKRKMSEAHKGYKPTQEAVELGWKNRNEKFFNKLVGAPLTISL